MHIMEAQDLPDISGNLIPVIHTAHTLQSQRIRRLDTDFQLHTPLRHLRKHSQYLLIKIINGNFKMEIRAAFLCQNKSQDGQEMLLARIERAVDELHLPHILLHKERQFRKHTGKRQIAYPPCCTGQAVRTGKRAAARSLIIKDAFPELRHFLLAISKRKLFHRCSRHSTSLVHPAGCITRSNAGNLSRTIQPSPFTAVSLLHLLQQRMHGLFPFTTHYIIHHGKLLHEACRLIGNLRTAADQDRIRQGLGQQMQKLLHQLNIPDIAGNPQNLWLTLINLTEDFQQQMIDGQLQNLRIRQILAGLAQIAHSQRGMRVFRIQGQPDNLFFFLQALTPFF